LVKNLGLEFHDHPIPYPLGWVNKDVEIKAMKQSNFKFVVSADFTNEVESDEVPRSMCEVVFESPYMYMRGAIFIQRANQYQLIKDGNSYIINAHKDKLKISLVSANRAKKLISCSKKYVFIF